jgi:hypothetical protein
LSAAQAIPLSIAIIVTTLALRIDIVAPPFFVSQFISRSHRKFRWESGRPRRRKAAAMTGSGR